MGGWTAPRRRALEAYVADLAARLRLADWTIRVDWDPAPDAPGEHTLAMVTPQPRKKHAVLRLGATFPDLPEPEQRQVLCHELVHCHLYPAEELVRSTFALLSSGQRRVAEIALEQQLEHATDALADALAPHAPVLDLSPAPRRRPTPASARAARAGTVSAARPN